MQEELAVKRRTRDDWNTWLSRGREWGLNSFDVPPGSGDLRRLEDTVREAATLEETIALLATPEREAAVRRMRQLQSEYDGATGRAARLDERLARASREERELSDGLVAVQEQERMLVALPA